MLEIRKAFKRLSLVPEDSCSEDEEIVECCRKLSKSIKRLSLVVDEEEETASKKPTRKRRFSAICIAQQPRKKSKKNWLGKEMESLEMCCLVDEYMTRMEFICEEGALSHEETSLTPWTRQELNTFKHRKTMMNICINSSINLDPIDCYYPLSRMLYRKKVQVSLGTWEIPNENVNGTWCVLSNYDPCDDAILGYINSMALQAGLNPAVRNAFATKLLKPWGLPKSCKQSSIHKLFVPKDFKLPPSRKKRHKKKPIPEIETLPKPRPRRHRRRSLPTKSAHLILDGYKKTRKRRKIAPRRIIYSPDKKGIKQVRLKLFKKRNNGA